MKDIYIRVDGNEIVATGHVMRCLSIAEQLQRLDANVTFIVADSRPCGLIEEKGFSVHILNSIWNDLDCEIEVLLRYIQENRIKQIIVDSYFVTEAYLQALSTNTNITYIDDLNRFPYPVQTVVNYSPWSKRYSYRETYKKYGLKTKFLLGGSYIPLREEFANVDYKVREQVSRVMITTGGTDQLNVAGNFLKEAVKLPEFDELEFHVVVGCFNQNKDMLQAMAKQLPNIVLHENVTDMLSLMKLCDVAVTAGGTTLYELCACGIPSICFEVADNQKGCAVWEEEGYMYYAGNACHAMEKCVKNIIDCLKQYQNNYLDRKRRTVTMQTLVDGRGAERIARFLLDGGLKNAE